MAPRRMMRPTIITIIQYTSIPTTRVLFPWTLLKGRRMNLSLGASVSVVETDVAVYFERGEFEGGGS